MGINDLLENLDPKTRKRFITAQQQETVRLPLASVGLTEALGGGIGAGRLTTIYGNTSAGKSALCLQSIGMWQAQGLTCAYVDSEMTYDKEWSAKLGVDNDELILIQKRSFGAAFDTVKPLVKAGLDVLVVDSISDLLPEQFVDEKGEIKDFAGQKQIGAHARSTSIFINGLHYINEKTALIALSQTTTDLSGMHPVQIPMGGKKLGFASSQIIKLKSSGKDANLKDEVAVGERMFEEFVGRRVEYTVEKNKMAPAGRTGTYNIYFDGDEIGIDRTAELVDLAERYGVVEKSGNAWFKYQGVAHNGKPALTKHVKENPEVFSLMMQELHTMRTGELLD